MDHMLVIVAVVMQGDAVELAEGIIHLRSRRGQAAIQRNTFEPRPANVHALALLYIAKVDRVSSFRGVGDYGVFHMTYQRPLRRAEEWMRLDVGGASSSS